MKWFRHFTNASDNDFIEGLEIRFGLEGYARWFKLLEIIARDMDKTDRCYAEHSINKWCSFLKAKQKILLSFLEHCENEVKIKSEPNGNVIKITCPKLLDFRDDYSRKSGHTPDKRRTVDRDTDTEVDTDKKDSRRGTHFKIQDPPADWIQFCVTQRPDLDAGKTFDTFRDYWIAKIGNNATKLDWFATWRNWVRNQKPNQGGNYGNAGKFNNQDHRPTKDERARAAVHRAAERLGFGFTDKPKS